MKTSNATSTEACLEQVYLFDRDAGLLCRILNLYAARGIDVRRAEYAYAAQEVMTLRVFAGDDVPDTAEVLRVLVEKAATFAGVLAAAERSSEVLRAS